MDYKEKYIAALERAKKMQETCDSTVVVGWCEYIFPELKESITISKVEYERLKELEKRMNILIQSFEIQKGTFLYGLDLLNQKKQ